MTSKEELNQEMLHLAPGYGWFDFFRIFSSDAAFPFWKQLGLPVPEKKSAVKTIFQDAYSSLLHGSKSQMGADYTPSRIRDIVIEVFSSLQKRISDDFAQEVFRYGNSLAIKIENGSEALLMLMWSLTLRIRHQPSQTNVRLELGAESIALLHEAFDKCSAQIESIKEEIELNLTINASSWDRYLKGHLDGFPPEHLENIISSLLDSEAFCTYWRELGSSLPSGELDILSDWYVQEASWLSCDVGPELQRLKAL